MSNCLTCCGIEVEGMDEWRYMHVHIRIGGECGYCSTIGAVYLDAQLRSKDVLGGIEADSNAS